MEEKRGYSDPHEGSFKDVAKIDAFDLEEYRNNELMRETLKDAIRIGNVGEGSVIQFNNVQINTKRIAKNCLIFCSAYKKSLEVMNQFEGTDTCYEIKNIEHFFLLITWALEKKLKTKVKLENIYYVDYDEYERVRCGKTQRVTLPSYIAKTKEFEPQCELRAVWQVPENFKLEEFYDLTIPGLRKYCKFLNNDDFSLI